MCAPGFEQVREQFERNFAERGEVGSAVAVTLGGEPVVDLWGGWADASRTAPWQRDTIVAVWSLGKAATSVCLLRQVDLGRVDLDAPVSTYWPEFAQAGKERLPVRYLLTHQAGLPAVRKPLAPGLPLRDWDGMVAALAEQEPWWEPGTRFGYHSNTHGFLAGELLRRVDGRGPRRYFAEEVARPFGVDLLFGTDPEDDARTAEWMPYVAAPGEESQRPWLDRDPSTLEGVELARYLTYRNPPADPNAGVNSRLWRAAEFPSTNPHSNARALARLFGILACEGAVDGRRLLSPELIAGARSIQGRRRGRDSWAPQPVRAGVSAGDPRRPAPRTFAQRVRPLWQRRRAGIRRSGRRTGFWLCLQSCGPRLAGSAKHRARRRRLRLSLATAPVPRVVCGV